MITIHKMTFSTHIKLINIVEDKNFKMVKITQIVIYFENRLS